MVDKWKRGDFQLHMEYAGQRWKETVKGHTYAGLFGLHSADGSYTMTHIPTGMRCGKAVLLKDAKRIIERALELYTGDVAALQLMDPAAVGVLLAPIFRTIKAENIGWRYV